MNNQTSIFDIIYPKYKITKPIRLIELFGGYGSQFLSLKHIGTNVEQWKLCEWAIKSIQAYKDLHFENDNVDYSKELNIEQIKEYLYNKGISSNYNEPMTKQQIDRLNEKQVRTIYNNIKATHNLVNIQQVNGKDLEIVDTDKYDYIMTYSFPCQDISGAGLGKGFNDTSTRSGMLWEVERILTECKELGSMPQILLMENVPLLHSAGENMDNFHKWQVRLEELGYKNYWQDLIATDFGIPQTRNRCFMVSILGDYSYTFPKPIPLKLKLKDMLEDNVDEKYYLSDKMIQGMLNTNYESYKLENKLLDKNGVANTILTRYEGSPQCIQIKNATKKGYLEATDGDGIDISSRMEHHRGTVQKEKTQTLTTQCDRGVVIGTYQYAKSDNFMQGKDRLQLGKEVSDTIQTTQKEGVVTIGNYSKSNHNASRIVDKEHSAPTVMENHGTITATQTSDLRIRKLTPRECFRLMGVRDEEYDKICKNQSDSSLYHLAGDSIVCQCLEALFKQLI